MKKAMEALRGFKDRLALKQKISLVFSLFPIQRRKIVFDNFSGRGYGCDPKYICEELRKRGENLDLVWLLNGEEGDLPDGVRAVPYGSWKAMYELATAGIWVDNVKTSYRPYKRKTQFYLQTWHSSLGLKKNEADSANGLPSGYEKNSMRDAKITDLMYANNDFRLERYQKSYWYHGPVIKCSVPRCSVLFGETNAVRDKVREYFGIPKGANIILYAPTFRRSPSLDIYRMDYEKIRKAASESTLLNEKGGDVFFLVRLHTRLLGMAEGLSYGRNVINATYYQDMQELLAAADFLISDYSGSIFECAFAKKPAFLYVPDLDVYRKNDRGLYFELEEMPFPYAGTEEGLCEKIRHFSLDQYEEKCAAFAEKIGLEEDGQGAVFMADLLLDVIRKREKKA